MAGRSGSTGAAVTAGNAETSQLVTDALYQALGVPANAQGTMNNLTFGDGEHQYYETICGGTGAGPDHDGTSAAHSHMTNSLLTDREILEARYPVVLKRFAIRKESGGAGQHRDGEGVVCRLRFLVHSPSPFEPGEVVETPGGGGYGVAS